MRQHGRDGTRAGARPPGGSRSWQWEQARRAARPTGGRRMYDAVGDSQERAMRVLLLGADGFLGRHVAERLLADPAVQLTALGRSDDADVRFDLSSGAPGVLARFLDAVHPGVVVNCAGTTRGGARELTRQNTVAVATVCEAMRRSGISARLVQVGCGSEYGPSPAGSSTGEDAAPRPGGPYGVSKLAATELVLGSGLDAVVLRVFSPVGPGTPTGAPLGRVAEALRRAMQNGEPELRLGGLAVQRDFVDARDVARAVHAASLSAAQGVVNIGSGRAVRMRDMATALAHVAGYEGLVREVDDAPVGGGPAMPPYPDGCGLWQQADVRTARDRLGWRPRIGLEESLADVWMEAACRV